MIRKLFISERLFLLALSSILLVSCVSIDRGMMSVSDAISSPDPVTGRREINLESEEKEVARATSQTNEILAKAKRSGRKLDDETQHYNRVKEVFDRLIKVIHRRHLPWEIHLVEDNAWNAFTIGGGKVFLYTGMFDGDLSLQSDDELAAVIAHEIAHVTARHSSEGGGKVLITQLADKKLRTDSYKASFTTNQEDEADRFSVIYSALAGYDPAAAVSIWRRMHEATGSDAGNMLYDHPLNKDRAKNLQRYSRLAEQYYKYGEINENHDSLLENNAVFSHRKSSGLKAGEGGGALALFETAVNTFTEVMKAKTEQNKRRSKQYEQERIAARQLMFRQLQIGNTKGGGEVLFGYAVNTTGNAIEKALLSIKYWSGKQVVYEDKINLSAMQPHEQRQFGLPLRAIRYTRVSISPKYVHFGK